MPAPVYPYARGFFVPSNGLRSVVSPRRAPARFLALLSGITWAVACSPPPGDSQQPDDSGGSSGGGVGGNPGGGVTAGGTSPLGGAAGTATTGGASGTRVISR